jgi:hypothetical protein
MIFMSLLFISTTFLAKAQCPLTKKPDDITINLPSNACTMVVNPSDFLQGLAAATATTSFNLSIPTLGYNQNNTPGISANTTNFATVVDPLTFICQRLAYTITRNDPNAVAPNDVCSISGFVVFRDITPPVLSNMPANVTVNCESIPFPAIQTAADNCDNAVGISFDETRTNGSCPDTYILRRTWTATDDCGNADVKTQTITVRDITAPSLTAAPADVTTCTVAGIPALPIMTTSDNCDNSVVIVFNEVSVPTGCGAITTRTWSATDRCNNATVRTQRITVTDNQAPTFTAVPANVTVECGAVPAPTPLVAKDNCTPSTLSAPAVDTRTNGACANNYSIRREWTATDACGNTARVTQNITVIDTKPPVLSASAKIVYSLGMSSTVTATSIDYTLTDNGCSYVNNLKIRRKSDMNGAFKDTLQLTCGERDSLDISIKAEDPCGLSTCINVTLIFQDKIGPIYLPGSIADTTVFCPVIKDPSFYGKPKFMESCGYTISSTKIVQDSISNCGVGSFKIEYIAKDKYGNLSSPILRKVTVTNPFPFDPNTIKWPQDLTYTNNQYTDPSQLPTSITGVPTWTNKGCDLIAMNMSEMILRVSPTACSFKIMRKWSVANCCKKTGMGTLDTPYVKTQMIVVIDNLAPKLDNLSPDVTVGCDTNCLKVKLVLQKPTANDCNNQATFPLSAFGVTLMPMPIGVTQDPNNPFIFNNVPNGKYKVTYIAKDESNNAAYHSYFLTVKDLMVPKLTVYNRLGTPLGSNGTTMVNIMNFIAAASDNCTPFSGLKFSFSPTKDSTMVMFDCQSSTLCNGDYQKLKIYVKDANGNTQVVDVEVDVQKGSSSCSCLKPVAGAIQTEKGIKVEGVLVSLTQNNKVTSTLTGATGVYQLAAQANNNFTIAPAKNDDLLNGVTTLDLVLITKHVLGTQKFTSPYQYIAADIDKSGKVTNADVVHLRKTILGVNSVFPQNDSWRFIDKAFVFQDPQNPVLSNIPDIKKGFLTNVNNDFIGVKVGDINGNVKANSTQFTSSGSRGILPMMLFEMKDQAYTANQEISVPVSVKDFGDIIAYQYTLNFDPNELEFIDIKAASNGADCEFGLSHLPKGMITTSWMNVLGATMAKDQNVFTLRFKAKSNGKLSKAISLTSDLTKAEAYNEIGEITNVNLMFSSSVSTKENIKLSVVDGISNSPNPFRESTTVRFFLKEPTKATLHVFDQTGRVLKSIDGNYERGLNLIELSDLPTGLMLYRIETPQGISDTRRMLRIE